MALSPSRRAALPAPTLPLAYFGVAHLALALAALVLVMQPELPGPFHYHPRLIGVVHLVTLGWISASILGAFYIVAPLAFGMPFPARAGDVAAFAAFWLGTAGMVAGFWTSRFALVGLASTGVLAGLAVVGGRAMLGLRQARLPGGVALHVALAFTNILVAGSVGLVLAIGKVSGLPGWSPLALASAHAHLAVLGWGVMMVIGVSYRLVPMFLPAAMPTGRQLATSAVWLQAGALGIAWALATGRSVLPWAACVLVALAAFMREARRMLAHRRPRPADMAGRDWSTWQTHMALLLLLVAALVGVGVATGMLSTRWIWAYGTTGLLGFLSQMVVGIQGRLLPLHAYYREMAALEGEPPSRSAHRLASPPLMLSIFLLWLVAVPVLTAGLMSAQTSLVRGGAASLLVATVLQGLHMALLVRRARDGTSPARQDRRSPGGRSPVSDR